MEYVEADPEQAKQDLLKWVSAQPVQTSGQAEEDFQQINKACTYAEMAFDQMQLNADMKVVDGDVAGNMLKILHREYGGMVRVVGMADGSGCAEDPAGLDMAELLRLVELVAQGRTGDVRVPTMRRGEVCAQDEARGGFRYAGSAHTTTARCGGNRIH